MSRVPPRPRRLLAEPRVHRRLHRVRWGNLRRLEPASRRFGYDRGSPIDRFYIEQFLGTHAGLVRGRVLEVKDDTYATRFGTEVVEVAVVDIDASNPAATIVVDLAVVGSLPAEAFDCAIVTQTLMYVADVGAAVANLWQSIAPGGSMLLTVASVSRVDTDAYAVDRW